MDKKTNHKLTSPTVIKRSNLADANFIASAFTIAQRVDQSEISQVHTLQRVHQISRTDDAAVDSPVGESHLGFLHLL